MRFLVSFILFFTFIIAPNNLCAEEPWSISPNQPVTKEVYEGRKRQHRHRELYGMSAIFFAFYQNYISDLDGATCYYRMTCSHYTAVAIERFGAIKGSLMGADRLIRCHTGQTDSRFDRPTDF